MKMIFHENEITGLIGEYASVIAKVTLIACGAYAQLREINENETREVIVIVEAASDRFVTAYKKKLARKGVTLSKAKTDKLRSDLNDRILADCWALMQKVENELVRQACVIKDKKQVSEPIG